MYRQRKTRTLLQPQKGGISSIWEEISPTHTTVSIVVWYVTKNNTTCQSKSKTPPLSLLLP